VRRRGCGCADPDERRCAFIFEVVPLVWAIGCRAELRGRRSAPRGFVADVSAVTHLRIDLHPAFT